MHTFNFSVATQIKTYLASIVIKSGFLKEKNYKMKSFHGSIFFGAVVLVM